LRSGVSFGLLRRPCRTQEGNVGIQYQNCWPLTLPWVASSEGSQRWASALRDSSLAESVGSRASQDQISWPGASTCQAGPRFGGGLERYPRIHRRFEHLSERVARMLLRAHATRQHSQGMAQLPLPVLNELVAWRQPIERGAMRPFDLDRPKDERARH